MIQSVSHLPLPLGGGSIHAIGFGIVGGIIETTALLDVGKIKIRDTVLEGGKPGVTVSCESITQTIEISDDAIRDHCNGFKVEVEESPLK